MFKDLNGPWNRITGAHSPLFAHPSQEAQVASVSWAIQYFISGGFRADQINMGMGTYGHTYALASATHFTMGSAAVGVGSAGPVMTN